MSYFLGFVPNRESNEKIRVVLRDISTVFDDFGIPVRWVKPNTFHISLYYLGESLNFINQIFLKKRISKIRFKEIKISLGCIKVGMSRKYKELVYIDIEEGGEELRELLLEVRKYIGGKDTSMFVPHLTIGRISKDLSKEEYRNLSKDVLRVSRKLKLNDIRFTIDSMYLIQSKDGSYSFKMKFDVL